MENSSSRLASHTRLYANERHPKMRKPFNLTYCRRQAAGSNCSAVAGECLLQPPYQCECESLGYSKLLAEKSPASEGFGELRTMIPPPWHQLQSALCSRRSWSLGAAGACMVLALAHRQHLEGCPSCMNLPLGWVQPAAQKHQISVHSATIGPGGLPAAMSQI